MSEPQSGAELLAKIKPRLREEITQICLRPDLLDAWEEANTALSEQRVKDTTNARLSSGVSAETKRLAQKVQDLEAEIEATAIRFHFRAMPKDEWRALCDNHPPRKGNDMDLYAGYDRDAVIDSAVRKCLFDPVFDDESWAQFLAVCNPSEWNELRTTVTSVNRSVVGDAPKSVLASQILSKRGGGSRSRGAGE